MKPIKIKTRLWTINQNNELNDIETSQTAELQSWWESCGISITSDRHVVAWVFILLKRFSAALNAAATSLVSSTCFHRQSRSITSLVCSVFDEEEKNPHSCLHFTEIKIPSGFHSQRTEFPLLGRSSCCTFFQVGIQALTVSSHQTRFASDTKTAFPNYQLTSTNWKSPCAFSFLS